MNVPRQVEIEFFHGHDLSIPSTGGSSFDTKSRSLTGLTNTGDGGFSANGAQGLGQSDCGGGLSFSERSGVDTCHDDVVTRFCVGSTITNHQRNLGLGNTPGQDFIISQTESEKKRYRHKHS